MNAGLKNPFLALQETLCSKSAGTLLLLSHQWLRVRMTRISLFSPSFLPLSLSFLSSLSTLLATLTPTTHSTSPCWKTLRREHEVYHICTLIRWHLQYVSMQPSNYRMCGLPKLSYSYTGDKPQMGTVDPTNCVRQDRVLQWSKYRNTSCLFLARNADLARKKRIYFTLLLSIFLFRNKQSSISSSLSSSQRPLHVAL